MQYQGAKRAGHRSPCFRGMLIRHGLVGRQHAIPYEFVNRADADPEPVAVASTLIVLPAVSGAKGAMPEPSRNSRTRTVVHVSPSPDLQRIRFLVTSS